MNLTNMSNVSAVQIANLTSGVSVMPPASWFGLVTIVGIAAIAFSLLVVAFSSLSNYKKLKGLMKFLSDSLNYFFIGIATLLTIAIPGLILYFLAKQAHQGNVAPLWITGSIIAGYFAISLIGWIAKRYVYDRVKNFEEEIKKVEKK